VCLFLVYILKLFSIGFSAAAASNAGQKVYGCALPPGYGSEDSQVLLYFADVVKHRCCNNNVHRSADQHRRDIFINFF